jgi:hypothetical protein
MASVKAVNSWFVIQEQVWQLEEEWVAGPFHPPGGGGSGRGARVTIQLHLLSRSRIVELYLHSRYTLMAWCLIKHRDNFSIFYDKI